MIQRALDSGLSLERLARAINTSGAGYRTSLSTLRRYHKLGIPQAKREALEQAIAHVLCNLPATH
jgi:hypothetical protein